MANPESITFWFSASIRSDFGYFHWNFTKSWIGKFCVNYIVQKCLEDKRHQKEHQKQFWGNITVKNNFWWSFDCGLFFQILVKIWRVEKSLLGQKFLPTESFLPDHIKCMFSISEFLFHLCFWVKLYDRLFIPILQQFSHFCVKICTFCGMQKFLHKSTQNQQMLKKIIRFKNFGKNICLSIPQL